jgi:hypothetical protein
MAFARFQRSKRVTPTHGPYSYDLKQWRNVKGEDIERTTTDSQVEDPKNLVNLRLFLTMN